MAWSLRAPKNHHREPVSATPPTWGRGETSWKKPWMNSYGHSLTTSVSLSAPEQQLDFSYKMPLLKTRWSNITWCRAV